ncbi:unnamed protein product [Phytomonas sp. Hart1]|nr:unnamed protein product [Phytomonas sp. Hart1]|eukprot:CCW69463.1 unnamed protein product [Phytomonas sp. isolate Hart1]
MPPGVPPAVPVLGVIPRRVFETRLRVFYAANLAIRAVRRPRDRRFVVIAVVNRNPRYSVGLRLSTLPFGGLPDVLIVPGAEHVTAPIHLSDIAEAAEAATPDGAAGKFVYFIPWAVCEVPNLTGRLALDLGFVEHEGQLTEPLEECAVELRFPPPAAPNSPGLSPQRGDGEMVYVFGRTSSNVGRTSSALGSPIPVRAEAQAPTRDTAESLFRKLSLNPEGDGPIALAQLRPALSLSRSRLNSMDCPGFEAEVCESQNLPMTLPQMTPVLLQVRVCAPWRRAIALRVKLCLDYHADIGILSGPVDSTTLVGERGQHVYDGNFELFMFKIGNHSLFITLSDGAEREVTYCLKVNVVHTENIGI